MKKALAIILALIMVFGLIACGEKEETPDAPAATPDAPAATPDAPEAPEVTVATPHMNEDGTPNLDKIAHYDPDYDYSQNPSFKISYIAQSASFLYQMSANAYEHWTPIIGCEWAGFSSSEADTDLYMTLVQTALDQGVTGFILDPDNTIFPAVIDLINQYPEAAWMSQMSPPRDGVNGEGLPIGGQMINPYVGFDNKDAGAQQVYRLIEWKEETYPDVPWEEVALLNMQFSTSPPLAERVIGATDAWVAKTGTSDNVFEADCVSGGLTIQGGIDAAGPIITTHPEYKYWLVMGLTDDLAQGAASVLDTAGLTETSCAVAFGGSGLVAQWDAGQHDAFRYALFTAQTLYAEPIIGAVYAFLNGWATPDTIWPSWVNWNDCGGEGHTYPQLRLPTCWLEPETYQHYLEWTDLYANADEYKYDVEVSLDDYTAFIDEIPPEYAKAA